MTRGLALGCGVLVVLLGLAGGLLKRAWEDNGRLEAALSSANTAIAVKEQDAALSARLIRDQDAALKALNIQVFQARTRIANAPQTSSCGPSVRDAAGSVRVLLADPAEPPAGR